MMETLINHWNTVFRTKPVQSLSWYQGRNLFSLALIKSLPLTPTASIIDVGAGASELVDCLLAEGFERITVLDIAESALQISQQRLGQLADKVTWLVGSITAVELPADSYDLWHDRAMFHFLTSPADRAPYLANLNRALRAGGYVIMAVFAEDAPPRCSGLPVQRYGVEALQEELPNFTLLSHSREIHTTPSGVIQPFLYCCFQKQARETGNGD